MISAQTVLLLATTVLCALLIGVLLVMEGGTDFGFFLFPLPFLTAMLFLEIADDIAGAPQSKAANKGELLTGAFNATSFFCENGLG